MRKFLAILSVAVVLASGLRVSIDHHYCGGYPAGVKISLTGKLASCGMESLDPVCPYHLLFSQKCCEDQISFYYITGKFVPEYFKILHPESGKYFPAAPLSTFISGQAANINLISSVFPPGRNLRSGMLLSEICVFRV